MSPKITVITVTYNAEKYIEETIISVINQTYHNVEFIIIDGGSTDGTVSIIKKYKSHIFYWISEPDNGIYDAMNKGIEMATGNWINFMNAGDCFVSERTLEKVFDKDYSEYDFIYGDRVNKDSVGLFLEIASPFWLNKKSYCPAKGVCHQSTFVKTEIARLHKYSLKYKCAGDYEMMYNIYVHHGKFKYRPIPIAIYNLVDGFSIRETRKGITEMAHILGKSIDLKFRIWKEYICLRQKISRFTKQSLGFRLKHKETFNIKDY